MGGPDQASLAITARADGAAGAATYSGVRRIWAEKPVVPDPSVRLRVAAGGKYAKQREAAAQAGHDLPPLEQVQRRARDPIVDLHGKGGLTDADLAAVHDLRRMIHGLSTDGLAGLTDPARLMSAGVQVSRRAGRVPFAAVNDVSHYRTWRAAMEAARVREDADVTLLQITVAVVIDLQSTRALDAAHHWKRGTALAALQKALRAY